MVQEEIAAAPSTLQPLDLAQFNVCSVVGEKRDQWERLRMVVRQNEHFF